MIMDLKDKYDKWEHKELLKEHWEINSSIIRLKLSILTILWVSVYNKEAIDKSIHKWEIMRNISIIWWMEDRQTYISELLSCKLPPKK